MLEAEAEQCSSKGHDANRAGSAVGRGEETEQGHAKCKSSKSATSLVCAKKPSVYEVSLEVVV